MRYHFDLDVTQVRTWRMHTFTAIQIACFGAVWTIKSLPLTAFAFPFALMLAVLIRHLIFPFIFTDAELVAVRTIAKIILFIAVFEFQIGENFFYKLSICNTNLNINCTQI